jgi:hypothetical protein
MPFGELARIFSVTYALPIRHATPDHQTFARSDVAGSSCSRSPGGVHNSKDKLLHQQVLPEEGSAHPSDVWTVGPVGFVLRPELRLLSDRFAMRECCARNQLPRGATGSDPACSGIPASSG